MPPVRPEDIDVVLCTHMHVDHVGWNTYKDESTGNFVPTFPNAEVRELALPPPLLYTALCFCHSICLPRRNLRSGLRISVTGQQSNRVMPDRCSWTQFDLS